MKTKVLAGLAVAAIGCGSKKQPPSPGPAATTAAANAAPVAPKAVDIDAFESASADLDVVALHGASLDALKAKATATLGAPTLVDSAHADQGEAIWAVVRANDGTCAQLRLALSDGAPVVTHDTVLRTTAPVDYGACADAAAGSARGRRFADALAIEENLETEPRTIARYAPILGPPSLRVEDRGKVRLIWAAGDQARCFALKATIDGGIFTTAADAFDAGLPWFDECSAWAGGVPTAAWATTVAAPALYARLTADGAPLRVAAAEALFHQALTVAHDQQGAAARDALVARLGKPRVALDGAAGWAVEDGTRCVSMWWRLDDDASADAIKMRDIGDAWGTACDAIVRGAAREATISNLVDWLKQRALPRDQEIAWLVAALGKPNAHEQTPGHETRLWAQQAGRDCVTLELTYYEPGVERSLYIHEYDPSFPDYPGCVALAAHTGS